MNLRNLIRNILSDHDINISEFDFDNLVHGLEEAFEKNKSIKEKISSLKLQEVALQKQILRLADEKKSFQEECPHFSLSLSSCPANETNYICDTCEKRI